MTDDDERKAARELVRRAEEVLRDGADAMVFASLAGRLKTELEASLKREGQARAEGRREALEALPRAAEIATAVWRSTRGGRHGDVPDRNSAYANEMRRYGPSRAGMGASQ